MPLLFPSQIIFLQRGAIIRELVLFGNYNDAPGLVVLSNFENCVTSCHIATNDQIIGN
jgi:hypothetical protein